MGHEQKNDAACFWNSSLGLGEPSTLVCSLRTVKLELRDTRLSRCGRICARGTNAVDLCLSVRRQLRLFSCPTLSRSGFHFPAGGCLWQASTPKCRLISACFQ